jgi:hypothetical protein
MKQKHIVHVRIEPCQVLPQSRQEFSHNKLFLWESWTLIELQFWLHVEYELLITNYILMPKTHRKGKKKTISKNSRKEKYRLILTTILVEWSTSRNNSTDLVKGEKDEISKWRKRVKLNWCKNETTRVLIGTADLSFLNIFDASQVVVDLFWIRIEH